MTITPPTPATPATPAPEKAMILTPQRKISKPRAEPVARAGVATQPQKVASDETNWRTKSPNQPSGWDSWQLRREKGGPDRDKWKYIMPASLVTTPIPDLTPPEEPDNKFSTPKKVPTLTPQRTMRRSLEQIQKAAASSPLCPPPPMPRSAFKSPAKQKERDPMASPPPSASKQYHKERVPVVDKDRFEAKDEESEPFDASDFPAWNPDSDVNSLWDTLSASKESAIYDVRSKHSPGFSNEEKVKRPLFTSEDDLSQPSTPRRHRSESSLSPERTTSSGGECSSPNFSSESMMTTPLKKKSGSMSESKSARKSSNYNSLGNSNNQSKSLPRRAGSMGSLPHASSLPRPSIDMDADIANFENNHVINSPNFDDIDDDNNEENDNITRHLSSSPLPMRDISAIISDAPIADLSPIAPAQAQDDEEDVATQLSHSSRKSHPSPLATRAIQPFPTFTIEEVSIEADSPVSEKKQSRTPASPSVPSPSAFASSSPRQPSDYASSECFAALASSNTNTANDEREDYLPPTNISFAPSPARPPVTITSSSPPQQLSSSPVSPILATPSSLPVPQRSSPPMQAQPVPSPVAPSIPVASQEKTPPRTVQEVQSPQMSLLAQMAAMGGVVNAFLVVFIAVLMAFAVADYL